jgi:hypothetical protein
MFAPASPSANAASWIGAESVPGFRKRCSTPYAPRRRRRCSAVVAGATGHEPDEWSPVVADGSFRLRGRAAR